MVAGGRRSKDDRIPIIVHVPVGVYLPILPYIASLSDVFRCFSYSIFNNMKKLLKKEIILKNLMNSSTEYMEKYKNTL